MQRTTRRLKRNAPIPESLNYRLNLYALAAGAAGVSLFAMAQPAEAEVIFVQTHAIIGRNSQYLLEFAPNHGPALDFFNQEKSSWGRLSAVGIAFASALFRTNPFEPAALNPGDKIGSSQQFYGCSTCSLGQTMAGTSRFRSAYGDWVNVSNRYLGFRFFLRGHYHYGWARLSVRVRGLSVKAVLTGYAYETTPNKPILAGQTQVAPDTSDLDAAPADPASLGALAQGSQGLKKWRRQGPVQRSGQGTTNSEP
jgi:hypothetical protein